MDITADLVAKLIAEQFGEFADLPIRPVDKQGWDNRTFRLGDEFSVRLPSGDGYSSGIIKEDTVLPLLAAFADQGRLPVGVPRVVGSGQSSELFPRPWTIRRWLSGKSADSCEFDTTQLAADLGAALKALRTLPADGGLWAGQHTHYRGCHPSVYGDWAQRLLDAVAGPTDHLLAIWHDGITSAWQGEPVWFHGDVAPGNVVMVDGCLSALIDFGQCGVGDPACDLTAAWTMFNHTDRRIFRDAVDVDEDTWRRARAWALWKAMIVVANPDDGLYWLHSKALPEIIADPLV